MPRVGTSHRAPPPLSGAPPSRAAPARRSHTFPARQTAGNCSPARRPRQPLRADTSGPAFPGRGGCDRPRPLPAGITGPAPWPRGARMRDSQPGTCRGNEDLPLLNGSPWDLLLAPSFSPSLLRPSVAELGSPGKWTPKLVTSQPRAGEGAGDADPGRRNLREALRPPVSPGLGSPYRRGASIMHALTCSGARARRACQPPPRPGGPGLVSSRSNRGGERGERGGDWGDVCKSEFWVQLSTRKKKRNVET